MMATTSLVDYLTEKFSSLSSKMWGNSFQPSSASFLVSGNTNFQQYDLSTVLGEVRNKNDYQIAVNPTYPFLPLQRFTTGIFAGFSLLNGVNKPSKFNNNLTEKGFSPYLFNFISDSYQPKHDPSFISVESKLQDPASGSAFVESLVRNQKTAAMENEKHCSPQVTEVTPKVSTLIPERKSDTVKKNCVISPTVRLNVELAHRKTKELSKRSKKRRRRQKKSELLSNSSSASDEDDGAKDECASSVTDSICFLSKSPDFGCAVSVTHTLQLSPCNSFLIPVTSDSEDDSEWETIDKIEISASNSETDSNASLSSNSSPIKCENFKSNSFIPVDCSVHVSSIISFVVPEDDSNDDDSDWDTCETSTFPENSDFDVSGLYFTNLCTPQSNHESKSYFSPEEDLKLRTIVFEANDKWNKLDDGQKLKAASKVTFAPDEDLVEVFPVEIFERKGEWEMYATARDRFRRRINELEKIISPCLTKKHRSKIFKKLVEPQL